jgi:uncharacterized protein YndB with AHSA1/START domain
MATPQSQVEHKLNVTHTFSAPRERVFRAWADAKELAQWFHPSQEYKTVITRLDFRVGGKYSIEMHHKDGNIHFLFGTYELIKPPEKLVFTWHWKSSEPMVDSLVTVEFRDLGDSTEVSLLHERLPNEVEVGKHHHGWLGCFGQLDDYLAPSQG